MLRTHTCGELRAEHIGQPTTLTGWVNRRRDHGGLVFVDLRDRYGLTQIVFDPDDSGDAFSGAHELGNEWVLAVEGTVRARPEGQANPDMSTGAVEVLATRLTVLNPARVTPFEIARELEVDEAQRLRYRYLDLRRRKMQHHLRLRHKVTATIRAFLDALDFVDVETPILLKSTPEGARDFLVPSRMQPGSFYALPQSPQQLKQLLMVAGLDRYYQIARCFRDEDLRADRQLEFTQLDVEMSFVTEEDILALGEELFLHVTAACAPHLTLTTKPFPRLTFQESIERFGNDKPDMRFGMELVDLAPDLAGTAFRLFGEVLAKGGRVKAIGVPAGFTRKEIDGLEAFAKEHGAGGLAWLTFEADQVRGSVARALSEAEVAAIRARVLAGAPQSSAATSDSGEVLTVFMAAGEPAMVANVLGRLRLEVAGRLGLIPEDQIAYAWILDPPLFEWNAGEARWDSAHHPFTAPQTRDLDLLDTDPGSVRARAYDIVCNGYELGSGSIRIHERAIQTRIFQLLGLADEQIQSQFGHMLEAFEYGAPPHGGIAPGLDRIVMILAGAPNIREVIPFPKTLSGMDLMTGSPSPVPPENLTLLGIAVRETPEAPRSQAPVATSDAT